jgi:hypothetical protein
MNRSKVYQNLVISTSGQETEGVQYTVFIIKFKPAQEPSF